MPTLRLSRRSLSIPASRGGETIGESPQMRSAQPSEILNRERDSIRAAKGKDWASAGEGSLEVVRIWDEMPALEAVVSAIHVKPLPAYPN